MRLTIGQLASVAGVPTSTIRYYERQGVLRPVARGRHQYRYYDDTSVERLGLIRAAQRSGFTLDDIKVLLKMLRGKQRDCGQFTELADRRLAEVEQVLADVTRVRDALADALQTCVREPACQMSCLVLEEFEAEASAAREPT